VAVTFYLVPSVASPYGGLEPKYGVQVVSWSGAYFGREPFYILALTDPDPTLDATIAADPECAKIPALANTVAAGALATVQAKVEATGIPANWINVGMTYQTVVQNCLRVTQLYQRLAGLGAGRLLGSGVTLGTTFNSLPAGVRQKLLDMADSLNFDKSSLSGAFTIRQILKALMDQWTEPILLRGVTF
jgi:hypothetical protein